MSRFWADRSRFWAEVSELGSSEVFQFFSEMSEFWDATFEGAFILNPSDVPLGSGLLRTLSEDFSQEYTIQILGLTKSAILSHFRLFAPSEYEDCAAEPEWINNDNFSAIWLADMFDLPRSFVEKEICELVDLGLIERSRDGYRVSPFFNRNLRKFYAQSSCLAISAIALNIGRTPLHMLPRQFCDEFGLTRLERICMGIEKPLSAIASANPERGSIYLVSAEGSGRFKIGLTTGSVETRVKSFRTGSAFPINIEFSFQADDVAAMESALHRHFDHCRVKGEWFSLSKSDIAEIKAIAFREKWIDKWREMQAKNLEGNCHAVV